MAERITSNLWRLDIPLVGNPLKNLNSYLITGERSLLIDTGFREPACREAMERQLATCRRATRVANPPWTMAPRPEAAG